MLIMNTFRGLPFILSIPTINTCLNIDFTKMLTQEEVCSLFINNGLLGVEDYVKALQTYSDDKDAT